MKTKPTKTEQLHVQLALVTAIALQIAAARLDRHIGYGPQYVIIAVEVAMALVIGFGSTLRGLRGGRMLKTAALVLLVCLSGANLSSLILVLQALIVLHQSVTGAELLSSAIAIFLTNIIVYAIWYWEIDSPGLTNQRWTQSDKDFQFTQHDLAIEFPHWQPEFSDYLYLSVTNAINFGPADTRPLTRAAKFLMGSQALISVFTLALVVARSVSILGT